MDVRPVSDAPVAPGSRFVVTRPIRGREHAMTMEMTELNRPRSWAVRGLDGPIRGNVPGTVEPVGGGERSRVTMHLDLEGHGIGRVLVPLVVRRQARREMPSNARRVKEVLEGGG